MPFQKGHKINLGKKKAKVKDTINYRLSHLGHKSNQNQLDALKLGRHKGKKHTEESKKKMSLSAIGKHNNEKNPMWKGGITPINAKIRASLEYKLWRKAVYERDNYTCVWCGNNESGNLNADHIKPFCDYPELRFAIDNGRTLCVPCHRTTETYGSRH